MMHKDLFSDGVARIDPDAVERLLQIEQSMQAKQKRQRRARLLVIPAVALVALLVCITVAVIPFIPKTYDLDYGEAALIEEKLFSNNKSVWVYYVNDKGTQKRERVRIPSSTDNVFLTWKHLNTVGDEVEILNYVVETNDMQSAVEPDTLWEFLQQQLALSAQKSVTVTLSPQITTYENYNALIDSLTQTIAKYAGVDPEQITLLYDKQQSGDIVNSDLWFADHSTSEFASFMKAYGLDTANPVAFKRAVQALSYNGVNVFDLMHEADVEWMPGYRGEMYGGSEFFDYEWSAYAPDGEDQSYQSSFTAYKLPDGMTLPHSITPEDSLLDALRKIGVSDKQAQDALQAVQSLTEQDQLHEGNLLLGMTYANTLGVWGSPGLYYAIVFKIGPTMLSSDLSQPEYKFEIMYSWDEQAFTCIKITTEGTRNRVNMFSGPIELDYPGNPTQFRCKLTDEHCEKILFLLNNDDWHGGVIGAKYEYTVWFDGIAYEYNADDGIFKNDVCYLRLSEQDRLTVNEILTRYEIIVEED